MCRERAVGKVLPILISRELLLDRCNETHPRGGHAGAYRSCVRVRRGATGPGRGDRLGVQHEPAIENSVTSRPGCGRDREGVGHSAEEMARNAGGTAVADSIAQAGVTLRTPSKTSRVSGQLRRRLARMDREMRRRGLRLDRAERRLASIDWLLLAAREHKPPAGPREKTSHNH
jgi:hypothetical protein